MNDENVLSPLLRHVEAVPGRIVSVQALVRGLAILVGDLRSSEEITALARALDAAAPAFAAAIEHMPSLAAAEPVYRHERVNHMGWPVAGTFDDGEPGSAGAPLPSARRGAPALPADARLRDASHGEADPARVSAAGVRSPTTIVERMPVFADEVDPQTPIRVSDE